MTCVFANRAPTLSEVNLFRLMLSTFRDGSGNEMEDDGSTRPNWRELERCVAALVNASTNENKCIFDVIARGENASDKYYGYSVKSKQLSPNKFGELSSSGRVYMEIANSPAKFWDAIQQNLNLAEVDFRSGNGASDIGNCVINLVEQWHLEGKTNFEASHPNGTLDLANSIYFCLSYSKNSLSNNRLFQVHAFKLAYPKDMIWTYKSDKCLSGYDAKHPTEVLVDWYGLSGGQLKYYPRADSAIFSSPVFSLLSPQNTISLEDKARSYFPSQFNPEQVAIDFSN